MRNAMQFNTQLADKLDQWATEQGNEQNDKAEYEAREIETLRAGQEVESCQ